MSTTMTETMSQKLMVIAPVGRTVGVPKAIRPMISEKTGEQIGDYYEEEVFLYAGGDVLDESEVSPNTLRRLDEGDPHLATCLRRLTEEQATAHARGQFTITVPSPGANPFMATGGDDNPMTQLATVTAARKATGK